ncbi:putative leucine-rich repeat domain superfamily [Helianthus annuus]|nr:disease resistance protein RUN1-like [Helianthus annuus]KAJ0586825.1 putative leucine-rich repeat domain superfamily [Helianthus annuus]
MKYIHPRHQPYGLAAKRGLQSSPSTSYNPDIVLEGLGNMKKLRCLIVYRGNYKDRGDLVKIDEVSQYLPNSLRYLDWPNYPHWCLPKTFQANNLVELHMSDSRITQLWVGGKVRTLDLGLTPNLVRLDLQFCDDLVELHVPVGCLKRLTYLNLRECKRLKSILFIKDLESLEVLDVSGLHLNELKDLTPSHSNNTPQQLDFDGNDIEKLLSSIGNLHKLVYLSLSWCSKLKSLPRSICSLQHLRVLNLVDSYIEELPEDIGQLECLEQLSFSDSEVKHLPDSICKLKRLNTLILENCKVCKLPQDLGQIDSLNRLDLGLSNITDIPPSICKLKPLKSLNLFGCSNFKKLPENLGDLESLIRLNVRRTKIRDVPSCICKLKHLKVLDLSECYELEKLPENLGDLECLKELYIRDTPISHLPDSISC